MAGRTEGMMSALGAVSSFAKGYAQVALLNRQQDRREEQWQKEFAFKEAQAKEAKAALDRQWQFEVEKYLEGAELRREQLAGTKIANELANVQLTERKLKQGHLAAALNETSDLFSAINFDDLATAYKSYMGGITSIISKYPTVELEDMTNLFDIFSRSAVAARTKGAVHQTVEDVDRTTGHTVLKAISKDGAVIGVIPLNKFAPGVTKVLEDADTWIKQERDAVLNEAKTGASVMGALNKGMLMLGDAVETGDETKKLKAFHTIVADLEAKQGERMKDVRDRLDKALAPHVVDKDQRAALVEQKMGAVDPEINVPLLSPKEYSDAFTKAYEEDKAIRPGLTPDIWASSVERNILATQMGQYKLNMLEGLEGMQSMYHIEPEGATVSESAGTPTVWASPEGEVIEMRGPKKTPYPKAAEIYNKPLLQHEKTGKVELPMIWKKRMDNFFKGRYEEID